MEGGVVWWKTLIIVIQSLHVWLDEILRVDFLYFSSEYMFLRQADYLDCEDKAEAEIVYMTWLQLDLYQFQLVMP